MINTVDTAAARELELFSLNSREIYCRFLEPIEQNFIRKAKKGIFNADIAPRAYVTAMREAAKLYCKYFGGNWQMLFNTATRAEVARCFVANFENEMEYLTK